MNYLEYIALISITYLLVTLFIAALLILSPDCSTKNKQMIDDPAKYFGAEIYYNGKIWVCSSHLAMSNTVLSGFGKTEQEAVDDFNKKWRVHNIK